MDEKKLRRMLALNLAQHSVVSNYSNFKCQIKLQAEKMALTKIYSIHSLQSHPLPKISCHITLGKPHISQQNLTFILQGHSKKWIYRFPIIRVRKEHSEPGGVIIWKKILASWIILHFKVYWKAGSFKQ